MKQTTSLDRLKIILFLLILFLSISPVFADEEDLFSASASIEPNVLMIFDNSNSMDEDFVGNSVCSWVTGSRSVEGRRALIDIVNTHVDAMRLGLMSYGLPSASKYQLHNSLYFSSYEPKSYCPNPPVECSTYCATGDAAALAICQSSCSPQNSQFDATYRDEIITNYAVGSEQRIRYCNLIYPKRNRAVNPTDISRYVYYKLPGTFYADSSYGADFCYSSSYNASEGGSDYYQCYNTKTGTSDDGSGYSSASMSGSFYATDEDLALGFNDFGRRMAWTYSGRTWFANSSPGGGHLHVAVDDNPSSNSQKNSLLAKLAMKEGDETGYMACTSTSNPNSCAYIVNAGLTPTAGSFRSAENYFKGVKDYKTNTNNTSPIQDWCQSNFIVYVTDGLPSVDENGVKGSAATLLPGVLGKIDNLRTLTKTIGSATYTFDVQTFVLGMALTDDARAHLDLMAVHGGTDVDGHAYYANNASELTAALNAVFSNIIERAYSFSTASVSSSRIQDENYIYETSFEPKNNDPFWKGYVKKYQINSDGFIGAAVWEAGAVLDATAAGSRSIHTRINSVDTEFTTANIGLSPNVLNLPSGATETDADNVVNYIRGENTPDNWKLGDTFHSNPITIGSPSPFFYDVLDSGNVYATYRDNRERSSANGKRLLLTGANDGQLHAFRTLDGVEAWSFIPPNLLSKLHLISHTSHPTSLTHQFFVDGPITVADAWLGSGTTKSWTDWRTLAVVSLGRNDRDYTNAVPSANATKYWSSSTACDTGLAHAYSTANPYYCGYYALDFTNMGYGSTAPEYKWHLNLNSTQAPYAGEPWSRMAIGRAKIYGQERWLGFIGAGFSGADCSGGGSCELRGKGFYVVDLRNGDVIWQYNRSNNTANLEYDFAAAPAAADMDNDGYIDSVFAGDTGGNVWRFDLCKKTDGASCGTLNWTGNLLMDKINGSNKQPIYTSPTVTIDNSGQVWLYWGTGDKTDPVGNAPAGYFWAIKPQMCTPTCSRNDGENLTSSSRTYEDDSNKIGWYINLAGQSEKILSDPVVFGGVVYFTSFTPASGGAGSCGQAGTAKMYAVKAFTGGGGVLDKTDTTVRSVDVGGGIPSTPVISMRPGTAPSADIYMTISGGGGQKANTLRVNFDPPTLTTRGNMLFWRDRRIQ